MTSMRRYLMVAMLAVVVVTALLLAGATYQTLSHELNEQYDANLVQTARLIAAFWKDGEVPNPKMVRLKKSERRYQRYFTYQLWRHGRLLLASDDATETPMIPLRDHGHGGHYLEENGWHLYAMPLSDDRWVLVGQSDQERRGLTENVVGSVLSPYILSIPLVLLLIWLAIRRGLRPLERLSALVSARGADNLTPLRQDRPMRELMPLVDSINTLLARLSGALEREKRFTADAAHELRTLLMVLKLHADNAATLKDPADVAASLSQLRRAVDRASRTVEQLLQLARLNPQMLAARGGICDASAITRDTLAILASVAERYDQTLSMTVPDCGPVAVPAEALQMVLRNLIDNACRYSPAGSEVRVVGECQGDQLALAVTDGGPGLTAEQREKFMGRFSRGHEDAPGAGLGLSIVDRILSIYGGHLHYRLKSDAMPAAAVVTLPLADGSGRLGHRR